MNRPTSADLPGGVDGSMTESRLRRLKRLIEVDSARGFAGEGSELDFPSWLGEGASQERRRGPEPTSAPRGAPPGEAFQLTIYQGGERLARRIFFQRRVRIGRSPECELHLDHPAVSRFHACVTREGGQLVIADLGSSNGVRVEGRRVRTWQLNDGDQIDVGEFQLQFHGRVVPEPRGATSAAEGEPPAIAFGQTLCLRPGTREEEERRERSVNCRAYLQPLEGKSRLRLNISQYVLDRDVLTIGGGEEADLRLRGWWTPRVCAVIVRGFSGYSVHPVAPWPYVARVNNRQIHDRGWLEDGDVLSIAGLRLGFRTGLS